MDKRDYVIIGLLVVIIAMLSYGVYNSYMDSQPEVFDLKDEETFKSLNRLCCFANSKSAGKEFWFNSVEDMLERINAPITRSNDRIIHYAAIRDPDLLKLCLKHPNINVNVQNILGSTPLHLASNYPKIESLKLLLERDDVDMTIEDFIGRTAEQIRKGDATGFSSEYAKNSYKKFW